MTCQLPPGHLDGVRPGGLVGARHVAPKSGQLAVGDARVVAREPRLVRDHAQVQRAIFESRLDAQRQQNPYLGDGEAGGAWGRSRWCGPVLA